MARPIALSTGVHLDVRVPIDLAIEVRGTRVTLPVGGTPTRAKIGERVIVSLRTKDPTLPKVRLTEAMGALQRYWEAMRVGPRALTHKQVAALAGEAYRQRASAFETDPAFEADALLRTADDQLEAVLAWRHCDGDGPGDISDEDASFYAAMQRPYGPQIYAFEHEGDLTDPCFAMTCERALEDLFGREADALCAERQLVVDGATRAKLIRQIGEAVRLAGRVADDLTQWSVFAYMPVVPKA